MNLPRLTLFRRGLLVVALPLLYQSIVLFALLRHGREQIEAQRGALHTKEILERTDRVMLTLMEAMAQARGYLLTNQPAFGAAAERSVRELPEQLAAIQRLIADNPAQQARFARVVVQADARIAYQREILGLMMAGKAAEALAEMRSLKGERVMEQVRVANREFRGYEAALDAERLRHLEETRRYDDWLLGGALGGAVLIAAIGAWVFNGQISSRIQVLAENARRLARAEALRERVSGSDEIAELDRSFHEMAGTLSAARLRDREAQQLIERRAAELLRINRELDQKTQENEMFVYSVSHDLRSPLVNLQGFSKELDIARAELVALAAGEFKPEERERLRLLAERDISEAIHFIQTAVKRLSAIIDALLRLSRAGRVEYEPRLVDLGEIVERIVTAMRGTIAERGAEITVGPLPEVWGDPTALEQIFANLIGNAVNYLDAQRPGRIEVREAEQPAAGHEAMRIFTVEDNGLGIAEAWLPKVFAAFQRLHGTVAPGEGIGLTLVRRMVERHGGRIWVESREGVGSTFFVALPKSRENSPLTIAPRKESLRVLALPK